MHGPWRIAGAVLALALTGGCVTFPQPFESNLGSDSGSVRSCAVLFRSLDAEIERAGVRDAAAYRIPGFPYLRTDRFLASFRGDVTGDEVMEAWVVRLREADRSARRFEMRNLQADVLLRLGMGERDHASALVEECSEELAHKDLSGQAARALLAERSGVPDDYSDLKRALGLYAITRIPFARGVERWHEEALAMFREARDATTPARAFRRFAPQAAPAASGEIAGILRRAAPDRLGIPRLEDSDVNRLLAAYAPVFEIETSAPSDRFGRLVWRDSMAEVDTGDPVVYQRLAYTRSGRQTLLQLVYTIWFPERPRAQPFDLLAGRLDGVVLRVTIGADGTPLVYDTIHPCGCFHMFFPTPFASPLPAPDPSEEWAFVPATLPALSAGRRVMVRIASRTHYLLDIAPDAGDAGSGSYVLADEDGLRSLPVGDGTWRSLYGPDGLVPGTERGERMFFWPMGIASAGAMRQWGRHATAFVGRRHFDDADLIERRFSIAPAVRGAWDATGARAGPADTPAASPDSSSRDSRR